MRTQPMLLVVVTISAFLQVRLFDVWGVVSPPDLILVPLLLVGSPSRRGRVLAAALWGGFLVDLLTGRQLGVTSLALVAAVFVGVALRGEGGASWLRRMALIVTGVVVFDVVMRALSGLFLGGAADPGPQLLRLIVDVVGASAGALMGVRRRAGLERRISARA